MVNGRGTAGPDEPGDRDDTETTGPRPGPDGPLPQIRLTAWVAGRVQGVGFRWWVRCRARELGLTGAAENLADGRVKVTADGDEAACRALLAVLRAPGSPGRVSGVTRRWSTYGGDMPGFAER